MTRTLEFAESITIEALERDPYPIYARLRREAPITPVPAANVWFATRWADVETIVKSPRLFTAEAADSPVERSFGSPTILTCEGAVHRELRGGLEARYRAREVSGYIDALARPIAERVLDELPRGEPVNLMARYFEPVSALALAETLGLGSVPAATLLRWFHGLSQGAINYENDPRRHAACLQTCAELEAELVPLLRDLADAPQDTPLSHMLHFAMPEGQCRPVERILPSVKVTLLGGMQEPGHGAGTVFVGLMQDRRQYEAVKDGGPEMLRSAVNEGLRWVAPIGTQLRTALEDVEIGGVTLAKGTPIAAILASANRDETRFADPDRFDIFREEGSHAAFGFGNHFCAGRWFSVALMEITLDVLFAACPDIRLVDGRNPSFRGWEFRMAPEIVVSL
ncbi:cytochrome P450 [Altericroceibacterium xinjiangense]|uniref:cytochrome P450 n=1 Tax=Altericroceibacterium xinjiangense TaxID=762261 RepID=UPI000F7D7A53|nr:cytochrome P450 [Altericroceibacterium xinjiangense]